MREMANWVLKAHEGKVSDVENFLPGGKMLVDDKPETVSWHARQPGNNTYAIFDTFAGNDERHAHLYAKVADALVITISIVFCFLRHPYIEKDSLIHHLL